MAYLETLAARIRKVLAEQQGFEEKKMFGGVGYMLFGNMVVGVLDNDMIVRVGLDTYESALAEPHTKQFTSRGSPMKGWVMVDNSGLESDDDLQKWINQAIDFVETLPRKT